MPVIYGMNEWMRGIRSHLKIGAHSRESWVSTHRTRMVNKILFVWIRSSLMVDANLTIFFFSPPSSLSSRFSFKSRRDSHWKFQLSLIFRHRRSCQQKKRKLNLQLCWFFNILQYLTEYFCFISHWVHKRAALESDYLRRIFDHKINYSSLATAT